jgi:hypothetical protein
MVNALTIGPKTRGFKPSRGKQKSVARLPSEAKQSRRPNVVRFYGLLKVPEEYYRDTTPAKFENISLQLPAPLLGVSAEPKSSGGWF